MDYKNSDLPWCSNCVNGIKKDGEIYCNQIKTYCLEDDFCGLHEWKEVMENEID